MTPAVFMYNNSKQSVFLILLNSYFGGNSRFKILRNLLEIGGGCVCEGVTCNQLHHGDHLSITSSRHYK